jgi:hypothetical protein
MTGTTGVRTKGRQLRESDTEVCTTGEGASKVETVYSSPPNQLIKVTQHVAQPASVRQFLHFLLLNMTMSQQHRHRAWPRAAHIRALLIPRYSHPRGAPPRSSGGTASHRQPSAHVPPQVSGRSGCAGRHGRSGRSLTRTWCTQSCLQGVHTAGVQCRQLSVQCHRLEDRVPLAVL